MSSSMLLIKLKVDSKTDLGAWGANKLLIVNGTLFFINVVMRICLSVLKFLHSRSTCSGRNKTLVRLESSELSSEIMQPHLGFVKDRLRNDCKPWIFSFFLFQDKKDIK